MASSGTVPANYEVRPQVKHGADPNVARPATSAVVEWFGTVHPNNAAAQDVYWNEQGDLPERYDGAAWKVQGGATYVAVALPEASGAKGDGITDDTAALTAWLASGAKSFALTPGKTYLTTATLTQPVGTVLDGLGSTIKASAVIAGPVLDTPVGTVSRDGTTRNITLACNNNAQTGFYPRYIAHHTIADVTVWDSTSHAVILGDPAAASNSYEAIIRNLNIDRPSRSGTPAGSFGLWCRNCTDVETVQAISVGNETGVRVDTGGCKFSHTHAWGYSTSLMTTCFDDNISGTMWSNCSADTPTTYGWRLRQFNTSISNSVVQVNSVYGVDNVVIGVQIDQAQSFAYVGGTVFKGADATHRLAADLSTSTGVSSPGSSTANVVTIRSNVFGIPLKVTAQNGSGFNVTGTSQYFNINSTSGKAIEAVNGTPVWGWTDNYTTKVWKIDSSNGAIQPGTTAGLGARIFSGTGAPTFSATAGDFYFRLDTPATANQRLYVNTSAGSGTTWTAIL